MKTVPIEVAQGLASALTRMQEALKETMPGLRYITCHNHAILTDAPLAANLALRQFEQARKEAVDFEGTGLLAAGKVLLHFQTCMKDDAWSEACAVLPELEPTGEELEAVLAGA